jgi:hypothetical protein
VKRKYCLLAVEGQHDQAAITKILEVSEFKKFNGDAKQLDRFWEGFIPKYPKAGNLYKRMDMPSILTSPTHSVAIYAGEGSNLVENIATILDNYQQYAKDIQAFGLFVDADNKQPQKIAEKHAKELCKVLPTIPQEPGIISAGIPRTGIYVLPDNKRSGVLDSILTQCASIIYPDHKKAAETFIESLNHTHKLHAFSREKALVACIVSILRPGMANTPSIAQDQWISKKTIDVVDEIIRLNKFIKDLLDLG